MNKDGGGGLKSDELMITTPKTGNALNVWHAMMLRSLLLWGGRALHDRWGKGPADRKKAQSRARSNGVLMDKGETLLGRTRYL